MCKLNILLLFHILLTTTIFTVNSSSLDKHYCEVREPKFNILYNFTKLTNVAQDIVVNGENSNELIRLQLCSPLKEKCAGQDGYGICLVKDKKETGIGKVPPKIVIKSGEILFIFTGDNCNANATYKVTIQMKCDYLAVNNIKPKISLSTEKQCNFNMVWKSIIACGPRVQQNCTVTDHANHYDLSTLTKYSDNYVIPLSNETSKIILNVCHSVIFQGGAMCQSKSGICLHNSKDTFINLGDVQAPPLLKNNKLQIEYTEGAICKNRDIAATDIKTTITFVCDISATDTIPEYVKGSEECHYELTWKTAAACSVESLLSHRMNKSTACAVTNPVTNITYDLQLLTHEDYYVTKLNAVHYKFRVCGPLMDKICSSDTGVCLVNNGTSMGKPNSNLMWKESGPYLNYTDGDLCFNGQPRYTIITFVCGNETNPYTPDIMEEHPCWLILHWRTNLVCEKRIKCVTANNEIDITPLMNERSNYVVKVNGSEFHINVCRPLVPALHLMYVHGSAACKATIINNYQYVNVTNLGFPKDRPVLNKDQQVELHYIGGSPCPEDSKKKISSNFTFLCDPNSKGQPEYKSYANCTYSFEWKTSIMCGAVTGEFSSPCIIKDRLLSHECDLSLLYTEQQVYHVTNKQGKQYSLSLCGNKKYCADSVICQGTNSYGSLATVIFDYNKDVIKLQYSNGSKCTNSSFTSEVRFICNETAGVGAPKLLWESQCSAEFEWYTSVTCACKSSPSRPSATSDKYQYIQNFSSSHAGVVASAVLIVVALLATASYFRDPENRACFRSCLNPFSSRRSAGRVQYCRVNTSEEARLLLDASDPTQCQTDSDDDLLNA